MLNNPARGNLEERTFYIAERDLRVKQITEDWLAKTGNLVWDGVGSFAVAIADGTRRSYLASTCTWAWVRLR